MGGAYTFADLGTQPAFPSSQSLYDTPAGLFDTQGGSSQQQLPHGADIDYGALYDDRGAAFASQGTQDYVGLASQDLPPYP